ncbi:META domain-containing protein [Pseudomonas lalucatii]|uniref:META domain-containing protein n=1 Tax=Pseudomonas lalucatii TaxID=1424203 RepID=A0ABS5Q3L3_9PSED|nr:META domain-containing protein [Pseudomonas lalucatii]MBS7663360.1 META domain-containing protein [Pseudomonas lalucatii]MBS7689883.1 META domain-containing protein [Pseudomonas lalucatii]MBS7724983.1 META domain-containing protein [Pseudomonas lalucatii]QVM87054.1 META domain-containing protein [Pseudomonas lalucatii]
MARTLVTGLLGASLLGCASAPLQLETERAYRIEWLGERPALDDSQPTLTLGEDGRAYGTAGCNHWFARYRLQGQRLSFADAGSTRRQCAAPLMEQEARFLDSLGKVQRWDVSPLEQLRLWPESGKPLRLSPAEG